MGLLTLSHMGQHVNHAMH